MIKQGIAVAVASLALAGCGSKLQCHDKVVADTLEGIVAENAGKEVSPEAVATLFSGGRITLSQTVEKSKNESGALQCAGLMTADFSRAAMSPEQMAKTLNISGAYIELERRLGQIFGDNGRAERLNVVRSHMPTAAGPGVVSWNIEYDVQRTSDGKDVLVNLQAAGPIIDYVAFYAQSNAKAAQNAPKAAPTPTPSDEGTSEGAYTNDRVTISDEEGPHGGDEMHSSLCPGQAFNAIYDAGSGILKGEDGSFGISFGPEHSHMDVEGTNKCFPEGRYRKVK